MKPQQSVLLKYFLTLWINNKLKNMASGCCGTKKQKLNNSSSVVCSRNSSIVQNGHGPHRNGVSNGLIVHPDMCYYCFEVLYCYLHQHEQPRNPRFSNEAL